MNRETIVGVVGMTFLGVGFVFVPGITLVVIGGLIGGLGILVWITRKLGI